MTDHDPTTQGDHQCYACPVGSFFKEFRAAEPEALEHVLNASYELLEVARVAIEAAERAIDEQRVRVGESAEAKSTKQQRAGAPAAGARASRSSRVRRIDIA